jgi:hypothetical protein
MSRLVADLEGVLQGLVTEHRKLLRHVEDHGKAVRAMDLKAMDAAAAQQEAARLRIAALETRRKSVALQLARTMKIDPGPAGLTLSRLAELHPPRRDALLQFRRELRELAGAITAHTTVSGRVARAVLGHLNTAVRLLAGAVERAGTYTRQGTPKVARRIGAMEAVG